MRRLLTALGALGSGLLLVACIDDKTGNLFPDADAGLLGGRAGSGGSGGSNGASGGSGGSAGMGGNAGGTGGSAGTDMPAGSGGGDAGADAGCQSALDCDDQNACTIESCAGGVCVSAGFAASGTLCGSSSADECTGADQCDDSNGACLPNDEPNGTACGGGSCTQGQCIHGQPVGCPMDVASAVPFNTTWSSVGRSNLFGGSCDSGGTPDYALLFTAPMAGTFRFTVHALVDSTPYTGADTSDPFTEPPDGDAVITVADGSCAGQEAMQLGCNDDVASGSNLDSQLDLVLTNAQTVTVYLNERTQTGGGTGTLSIRLVP